MFGNPDETLALVFEILLRASYDNKSPNRLPIYIIIYGLTNASKNDIDISIYDWEKAYKISYNKQFTMYMPINMNGFDILKHHIIYTVILLPIYQIKLLS